MGQVKELIAIDQNADGNVADNQVTRYMRWDSVDASRVTHTIHPDSNDQASGDDLVRERFFVNGQTKSKTDQRGVTFVYDYDEARMLTREKVTNLPKSVDAFVRAVATEYDDLDRVTKITSLSEPNGGRIRNEIAYSYLENLSVSESRQSHDGPVVDATPSVAYIYDRSSVDGVLTGHRLSKLRHPSGGVVSYEYGTGITNATNRVT